MRHLILINEICPTTAQEWVKKGAILVDVREKDEVAQLSYDTPNIVNIPLSEFENRYTELTKDKDLVIVCRSGARSLRAAGFLINKGYDALRVVNMQHGIIRWVQKGFPAKGNLASVLETNTINGCCASESTKKTNNSSSGSSQNDNNSCC